MSLIPEVTQAFAPDGALSHAVDYFLPRQEQLDMALAVTRAIENSCPVVIEAGTGVGKTFAYLVPALLSGERVLLSTATKALQDQLFSRDLPGVVKALGMPVKTALLKGRASYLCLHRLETARLEVDMSQDMLLSLSRIEQWSQATAEGDLAGLPGLDERSAITSLVTSTRENCLGTHCPRIRECHVNLARKKALAADVLVVNHHLFFADLALGSSGMTALLPAMRIVVFDEAHHLNQVGIQFLGTRLTTGQLLDFSRDVLADGLRLARGLLDWHDMAATTGQAARELRLCVGPHPVGTRLGWTETLPDGLDASWTQALQAVRAACLQVAALLATVSETAPEFVRLHDRAHALAESADAFMLEVQTEGVRWLDVGAQLQLVESPLDISEAVKGRMLSAVDAVDGVNVVSDKRGENSPKTWVFTSATLGDDDKLSWFTQPAGLESAEILRIGSPFDYASQAALYVPPQFSSPGDADHSQKVADYTALCARQLGGRTMVLTTTLKALRTIGQALGEAFRLSGQLQVLVQGEMPKHVLMERFRSGQGCVLVGSSSFWEGIDIPGKALQLVVIDKLPFPSPGDPLAQARSGQLEAQGRSPFKDYFLPEAAMALKQGAGRLIRRETDQGVLVVCDSRLVSKGYGRRLLRALPEMHRLGSEQELMDRLAALTRTGTKECQPL